MTGILIPELVIYQTLENITKYIRDDLKNHEGDDENTFLYRLLGLDDDGNPMKMNRYNYFVQAKKMFTTVQNLKVNFGYNFEAAKIICFHIILPSEQPSSIPLGEDEGYQTEYDENGIAQMKFCQMFSSTYQIMITSDNSSEVNLIYHIYKSLFIALVPHLSLKGLLNPKFSGNDIVFQDDQMPMGIFHKVLNLTFDYELVVPQLLMGGLITAVHFEGTPSSPTMSPSGSISGEGEQEDSTGKNKSEYPMHEVEPGMSAGNVKGSSSEELPSRLVESGKQVTNAGQGVDYPTKRVEPGNNPITFDAEDSVPSKRVEPGNYSTAEGKEFPPSHVVNGLLAEDNTLRGIRIAVTDGEDVLMPGVAVQIKSEHYLYYAITNENGIAIFPQIANEVYTITVAKSGVNQGEFPNIIFDSPETYIKYSQVSKTIWDGMHADTAPILYVDIHDGGRA